MQIFCLAHFQLPLNFDTGTPYSFLTKTALNALKVDETQNMFAALINGHSSVKLSTAHFH